MSNFETRVEQPSTSLEELAEKFKQKMDNSDGKTVIYKDEADNIRLEEEKLISESNDFLELFKILNRIEALNDIYPGLGLIIGTKSNYMISEIKKDINGVRSGRLSIDYITRRLGLRNKVEELLMK